MKNIVITNFYGYENIGDRAILDSALKILNKIFKEKQIYVHVSTESTASFLRKNNIKAYLHPYGIAIKTGNQPISSLHKVTRFTTVVSVSLLYSFIGKIFPNSLPETGDYSFIRNLKEADIVLGAGGGYLRTKDKIKDNFGLFLTLLPIFIAHLYGKRILYLPMSYGNFASLVQDKITFQTIKNDDLIFRDKKSLTEFNKHSVKKLSTHLIPDLALFDENKKTNNGRKNYIVLTARLWLNEPGQKKFEQKLALFVEYVWAKYALRTIFIPMVWNKKEEDDSRVGKRIEQYLKNKSIFQIASAKDPKAVKKILAFAHAAVCTRMHSAILSSIVCTPFITISYEYKTEGLLEYLNLKDWNLNINDFSESLLEEKFDDLLKNKYQKFINQLKESHKRIASQENKLINIMEENFGVI